MHMLYGPPMPSFKGSNTAKTANIKNQVMRSIMDWNWCPWRFGCFLSFFFFPWFDSIRLSINRGLNHAVERGLPKGIPAATRRRKPGVHDSVYVVAFWVRHGRQTCGFGSGSSRLHASTHLKTLLTNIYIKWNYWRSMDSKVRNVTGFSSWDLTNVWAIELPLLIPVISDIRLKFCNTVDSFFDGQHLMVRKFWAL